jgi:predicted HNH restriction endonuclease
LQSYEAQRARGRKSKLELIRIKGMQCEVCGYSRNYAALEFHHTDPASKDFQLDLRSLSNRRWDAILEERKKCLLLCSNCHAELHNPDCAL